MPSIAAAKLASRIDARCFVRKQHMQHIRTAQRIKFTSQVQWKLGKTASCAVTFSPANGICTPSSTSCWYWDGLQWHVSPHLGKDSSGGSSWSSPVRHLTCHDHAATPACPGPVM